MSNRTTATNRCGKTILHPVLKCYVQQFVLVVVDCTAAEAWRGGDTLLDLDGESCFLLYFCAAIDWMIAWVIAKPGEGKLWSPVCHTGPASRDHGFWPSTSSNPKRQSRAPRPRAALPIDSNCDSTFRQLFRGPPIMRQAYSDLVTRDPSVL